MPNISFLSPSRIIQRTNIINRYYIIVPIRNFTGELSATNDKLLVHTDNFPPIAQYNLKQIQNHGEWDQAFASLLTIVDKLSLTSISYVLKQCGIFIYRIRKYEKYCLSQDNEHRLRLLDALVKSIITRISCKLNEVNDQNAGVLCEILHFFSKNYYQSAYRIYETLENKLNELHIEDMQLQLNFISSLTNFTRIYGMMSNEWAQRLVLKMIKSHNKLTISSMTQALDILSPKMSLSQQTMDKIIDTALSLLNYTEMDMLRHFLTHKTLFILMNNLVKLYKIRPSEKHFLLQKRLLELHDSSYGASNYCNMSESNLNKLISSLHKMLVISLIHECDDVTSVCMKILEKITLGIMDRLLIRTHMTSNWGVIGSETVKYLVILGNVNYLAKSISSSPFTFYFEKLLKKIAILWDKNEFTISDTYSCVLLINLLKSKINNVHANKLIQLVNKKCKWQELTNSELNATLKCMISLKQRNLIDSLDSIIPQIRNYKDLQIDTAIDLNQQGLIDLSFCLYLAEETLDRLNLAQLARLEDYLTNISHRTGGYTTHLTACGDGDMVKELLDRIAAIVKSGKTFPDQENICRLKNTASEIYAIDDSSSEIKLRAVRSARRLGLPIQLTVQ